MKTPLIVACALAAMAGGMARAQAPDEAGRGAAALAACLAGPAGPSLATCLQALPRCEGAACDGRATAILDQLSRDIYREIEDRLGREERRDLRIAQVNSEIARKHACGLEASLSPPARRGRAFARQPGR
jgi:hypothetical protein